MTVEADKQNSYSITLSPHRHECKRLFQHWQEIAVKHGLPDTLQQDLKLVIEEAFINIASHAYTHDADAEQAETEQQNTARLDINIAPGRVSLTFVDQGRAFDPLLHDADMDSNDHSGGGMGIHIIQSLTDSQEYQRNGEYNVFTVSKSYTSS